MKARAAAVFLALAAIAGCTVAGLHARTASRREVPAAARAHITRPPSRYLGVVTSSLPQFDASTGIRASLSVRYLRWGQPFPSALVAENAAAGAETLLEIEPWNVPLSQVAAGRQDAWLHAVAAAVAASRDQVMISLAPEMNGRWYPWGVPHTRPAVIVAAWRHVHQVLARDGAARVTWLWQVAPLGGSGVPLRSLWPGRAYVSMTGVDAYFYTRAGTFPEVFGRSVAAVRAVSGGLPLLISETAAGPGPAQASQVSSLFTGVESWHLAGLVWFDLDQASQGGLYRQDWHLEDSPALTAFRRAARRYL